MHDETRASRLGYSVHGLLHMTVWGRLNITSMMSILGRLNITLMRSILGYWEHICGHAQEFISTWIEIEIYSDIHKAGRVVSTLFTSVKSTSSILCCWRLSSQAQWPDQL